MVVGNESNVGGLTMQGDVLPVRGHDAIEILVNDHILIKSLLTKLTQAADERGRQSAVDELKGVLTIHNATEENLVYPALRSIAGRKSESEHLYHETAEADVLAFELDAMLREGKDRDFAAKAKQFQRAVLEHIDHEEHKAFPHLRERAAPQQAQLLTESVREFRTALRFASRAARIETGEITGSQTGKPTPATPE